MNFSRNIHLIPAHICTAWMLRLVAGEDFFEAGNLLSKIQGQADLLALALGDKEQRTFEPVLTEEAYTLDELLALRHQWRENEEQKVVPTLRIEELQNKSSLLEQRRDDLLRQYESIPVNAPARINFGVAYGSDKEAVKEAAREAASGVEFIL
ncbi:MAG: hypothetical protein HKN57_03165 [Xanthomonadales bacterium]|nr:hypothetical protein [Gammaproteobacteria bacterium]NND56227.1 hypothetical protein [Xanthomonadales bacterium]